MPIHDGDNSSELDNEIVPPHIVSRIRTAQALEEAQVFLRTMWRTDFFTGYSLAEALGEQIALIGTDEMEEPYLTKLKQVQQFRDGALAAITQAEEYPDS
jgi:hypothetical protein